MRTPTALPLPAVYAAVARARHLTPAAAADATGLGPGECAGHVEQLRDLGWVQPSRDVRGAVRATHPAFALGLTVLDMLEGVRQPGALAPFGGFPAAARLLPAYRLGFPATYLPTSMDSFGALVEEALTQAADEVCSFHSTPVPGSAGFIERCVGYLTRRGVGLRVVMAEGHHADGGWEGLAQTLRALAVPVRLRPQVDCRGVVVDRGALAVLHTDAGGVRVEAPAGLEVCGDGPDAARPAPIRPLTVLRLLGAGATTTAAAHAAHASARTVERDIALLQQVFEAEGRADLIRRAALLGLV